MKQLPFSDIVTQWDCPPINEAMIRVAETQLGFPLPESYLDLLKQRNGGCLEDTYYHNSKLNQEITNLMGQNRIGIGPIFGIGGDESIDSLINSTTMSERIRTEWNYPENCIVISHMGHAGIALCYELDRNGSEPTVLYVYSEQYPKIHVIPLEKTFRRFIDLLRHDSDG